MNNTDNFNFHPKNLMLVVAIAGLSAMFLALSIGYLYTRIVNDVPPIRVPPVFLFNTAILYLSTYCMRKSRICYKNDDTNGYLKFLLLAIGLSILFMSGQCFGWYNLMRQNIHLQSSVSAGYLYLISILHLLHVLVGLPFLIYFYWRAKKLMVEPVTVLLYFSDPYKRLQLRLLTIYWHFLDILWIYLVVFLVVNMVF